MPVFQISKKISGKMPNILHCGVRPNIIFLFFSLQGTKLTILL